MQPLRKVKTSMLLEAFKFSTYITLPIGAAYLVTHEETMEMLIKKFPRREYTEEELAEVRLHQYRLRRSKMAPQDEDD